MAKLHSNQDREAPEAPEPYPYEGIKDEFLKILAEIPAESFWDWDARGHRDLRPEIVNRAFTIAVWNVRKTIGF